MLRKEFIWTCCAACAGGGLVSTILEGCAGARFVTAAIEGNNLIIPLTEFEIVTKEKKGFRKYMVAQNDQLQYPVYVYRFDESRYSALWMKCTHQGTELQALGDKLHCPGHGSEFNNQGGVDNGPATDHLKTFPVTVADGKLKISLK